jgi:hypothetical protein
MSVTLGVCAFRAMLKEMKLSSDGGDCVGKKWKKKSTLGSDCSVTPTKT